MQPNTSKGMKNPNNELKDLGKQNAVYDTSGTDTDTVYKVCTPANNNDAIDPYEMNFDLYSSCNGFAEISALATSEI